MKNIRFGFLLLVAACCSVARSAPVPLATGEQIYVPIYSSIFYHDAKRTIDLAATLSIHNVNPEKSITIARVDYYNTTGKLIRQYLEKPVTLAAFETRNFVVEKTDTSGGTGANFLVEWSAPESVVPPLVEALMVAISTNQSVSFTSQGKVIKSSDRTKQN